MNPTRNSFPIGTVQELAVVATSEHGLFLTMPQAGKDAERVLLPKRYVPAGAKPGDLLEVFLYLDSEDRVVASTDRPRLMLREVGRLPVKETGKIGAFLDWGLPKDLLLPFNNQTTRVHKGDEVLCAVDLDKSGRLVARMNVYDFLEDGSPYHAGDWVTGTAYEKSDNFGIFVAVDDRYSARISKAELVRDVAVGETVRARVASVQPDGRLSLSLRETAVRQMETDADLLEERLKRDGRLPFSDKASPELIREACGMSKNEFKRAVGRLLKMGRIEITEKEILWKG